MNRPANPIQRTRRPSLVRSHAIVAKLQLHDEEQRQLHDTIRRFHSGRWPIFRALGMRQIDGVIYEAVQWFRIDGERYSVVKWQPDGLGLSWTDAASAKDALTQLQSLAPPSVATADLPC